MAWFTFKMLVSLCAQFHHSNIDFPDAIERLVARLIVTPRYHATHHAVDRRWGDRNFSTILSVWDPLLGTAVDAGPAPLDDDQALGLPQGRELAFSLRALLMEPVAPRNLELARHSRAPRDLPRAGSDPPLAADEQ